MKWLLFLIVIGAFVVQPNDAQQPTNVFSFLFNTIFRRQSNRPSRPASSSLALALSGTSSSSSSSSRLPSSSSQVDRLVKTVTTTVTSTVEPSTEIVSEFYTVTETITERLIATSTMTRKMTATATHVVTSCPDVGLRRINWKEIPNRIEEILKIPTAVEALDNTQLPDGPFIIGRSINIESSAEEN